MKYRPLGTTGVRVSQLGLGTMPFGGDTDEDEAGAIVAACLDVGINLFDCADVYTAAAPRRSSAVSSLPCATTSCSQPRSGSRAVRV